MLTKLICGITCFSISFKLNVHSLNAYAWQSNNGDIDFEDFPENQYLKNRPNVAIGFSGGGSRAYVAAVAQISALHELDLLDKIKYIGGISGGGWATIIVSYAQNINNIKDFLCETIQPEEISIQILADMKYECIRKFANSNLIQTAFEKLKYGEVKSISEAWNSAVQKTFLDPVGILPNKRFSWSTATVEDIKSRNPNLQSEEFLLPANQSWPFLIVGIALVGPSRYAPYGKNNHNYSKIDITPLYVGQMKTTDVIYKYFFNLLKKVVRIGGLIESFAFAPIGMGPTQGLSMGSRFNELRNIPEPEKILDLQFVAGTSTYVPASLAGSIPFIGHYFNDKMSYWSPAYQKKTETQNMISADGGVIESVPLISFLQRKVKKIILFMNCKLPLQDFNHWNVSTNPLKRNQISDAMPSYFGIVEKTGIIYERAYDYGKNHVFKQSDYSKVVIALQRAQQQGNGIIATLNLTTIRNDNWGISDGFTTQITFVYLGRISNWENKLSNEIKEIIRPSGSEVNLGEDIKYGRFKDFPHYDTLAGGLNYERSNLLANMVGYGILENKKLFKDIVC